MKKKLINVGLWLVVGVAIGTAYPQIRQTAVGQMFGTDRSEKTRVSPTAYRFHIMQLESYGGTNSGLTSPWNTAAIGPVLEVRRHLSELQQASLAANRRDSKERVLVRFEVTEAWIDTMHSRDFVEVPVRTVLYWAKSQPGKLERFGEVRHIVVQLPEGGEAHSKVGAALDSVEIETLDFFVTSSATGDRVYGTDGWKIEREKSISKQVGKIGQYNDAVAFYDASLLQPVKN